MTFTLPERAMIRMLFQHGTITEMRGSFMDGNHERWWEIIFRPKNLFRDESYYDIGFSGSLTWESADSVDEALDKLQEMMQEVAA